MFRLFDPPVPAGTPRVGTKGTTQKARSRRRRSVASASGRDDPDLVPSRTNSNHSTSPRPQVVGSSSSIKPNRTRTTAGPHDVAASMVHRTPPPQGGGVPRDRGFERRGPLTPQVHPQPRRPGRADDRRTRVRREDGRDHRAVRRPGSDPTFVQFSPWEGRDAGNASRSDRRRREPPRFRIRSIQGSREGAAPRHGDEHTRGPRGHPWVG